MHCIAENYDTPSHAISKPTAYHNASLDFRRRRLNPETGYVVPVARVSERLRDVAHKVIDNLIFGRPQPTAGRHSTKILQILNFEIPLIALFLPFHRVGAIPYLALSMVIQLIG